MAETKKPKIISQVFTNADGKIVPTAAQATRVEVLSEDADGTRRSTLIALRPSAQK